MKNHRPDFYTANITLQLRDSITDRIIDEVHSKNFAANQVIRQAKWQQRQQYKTGLSGIGSSDTDYTPHSATQAIALTDSSLTPDPANEWTMPGKLIGYATKSAYAGPDPLRGTPNITTLEANENYSKWVFDWPTNAGNGTINSVGWVSTVYVNSATDGTGPCFLSSCTIEQTWSTPQTWRYFARANANLAFGSLANTVVYVLNSTYQQTTTFNVNGQFTAVRGIAWDSGNSFLWVIGDNGAARVIAAYNSSGVLQTGPHTLTTRSYIALAHDGTKLWSMTQNTNNQHTMWSINTSNGSDISNFNFTTYYNTGDRSGYNLAVGLCWDPSTQRLLVRTAHTNSYYYGSLNFPSGVAAALYAYDTSGNEQLVNVSLVGYSAASASYNTYLWNMSTPYHDFDVIDSSQFAMPQGSNVHRVRLTGLGTRSKLDSPVVKTNTQTLKVIYQINYV